MICNQLSFYHQGRGVGGSFGITWFSGERLGDSSVTNRLLKGTVENSVFFPIHPHSPLNPFIPMSDQDNFSLQYQYNIKQISDENKEKYQFGDN